MEGQGQGWKGWCEVGPTAGAVWCGRHSMSSAIDHRPCQPAAEAKPSCSPPTPTYRLGQMTIDLMDMFQRHGYEDAFLFGHALEGNLHLVFSQVCRQCCRGGLGGRGQGLLSSSNDHSAPAWPRAPLAINGLKCKQCPRPAEL